jgi:hypothetical protein
MGRCWNSSVSPLYTRIELTINIYIYMYRIIKTSLCTWWLQYKKYSNSPHRTDDLKMAITEYIRDVECAILNTVFDNTVRLVNKCLETGREHLNINCKFLYFNHQVLRDFLIALYTHTHTQFRLAPDLPQRNNSQCRGVPVFTNSALRLIKMYKNFRTSLLN